MSTYLELVNKVIQEGASEQNELTLVTWSQPEAGRRIYPRFKRLVSEQWKLMQMSRDEWEFNDKEMSIVIYPRIKLQNGTRAAGTPPVGAVFVGQISTFKFTVKKVITHSGSWTLGTAVATIEFDENYVGSNLLPGETFEEESPVAGDGEFIYLQKGSYDFREFDPTFRTPIWGQMVVSKDQYTPVPVLYIPWENWVYQELSFTQGSRTVPQYVSQDYEGHIVFYPQNLDPFRISIVYSTGPQILTLPTDVPVILDAEYHEWIAWETLMRMAKFDKNPDLYSYALDNATLYKNRAEKNLMPLLSWGASKFNRTGL